MIGPLAGKVDGPASLPVIKPFGDNDHPRSFRGVTRIMENAGEMDKNIPDLRW
jgi:hypothetical protein